MKYDLIVFDMDGTILDTLLDLTNGLNYSLQKNGYPTHSIEKVRFFVGNGIKTMISRAVPIDTTEQEKERIGQDFLSFYKEHCSDNTKSYCGIKELLIELKNRGKKLAVVSNKDDYGVQILAQKFFPNLFDVALGLKNGFNKKPNPDMVLAVLNRFENHNAVFIGDSDVDFETAKNSKLDFIGVDWGFRGKDFLLSIGAKKVAITPKDILEMV